MVLGQEYHILIQMLSVPKKTHKNPDRFKENCIGLTRKCERARLGGWYLACTILIGRIYRSLPISPVNHRVRSFNIKVDRMWPRVIKVMWLLKNVRQGPSEAKLPEFDYHTLLNICAIKSCHQFHTF